MQQLKLKTNRKISALCTVSACLPKLATVPTCSPAQQQCCNAAATIHQLAGKPPAVQQPIPVSHGAASSCVGACPNLGAFRWLFMSNKQARVGTGRYAPRALGILSGVMLLAAVPAVSWPACSWPSLCRVCLGRDLCGISLI